MRHRSTAALATVLVAAALSALSARPARADVIDKTIARFGRMSKADLATLLWARGVNAGADGKKAASAGSPAEPVACRGARDEGDHQICELLADHVRATYPKDVVTTLRVAPAPLSAGELSLRSKSLPVVLAACLYCTGFTVNGRELAVVGRTGAGAQAEPLRSTALVFDDEQAAKKWTDESLPRMVADVVVEIPAHLGTAAVVGRTGVILTVKAYRVFDPCTGAVAVSQPTVGPVAVDERACAAAQQQRAPREAAGSASGPPAP